MNEILKTYWQIIFAVVSIVVSLTAQWAILGIRIAAVEQRQDRQGNAITDMQSQLSQQAANYAELKAKIDAVSDNVSYIRSRIDSVVSKQQ